MKILNGKLHIEPFFVSSEEEIDDIEFIKRDASIYDSKGNIVFEMKNVEFPAFWSDTAVNIVSDKFFRVRNNGVKENSLKNIVDRVVDTITKWGINGNYFDKQSSEAFALDLKYLLYCQYYAFNSPVFFNCGIRERPQTSACFIQSVEDDMNSIMDLAKNEALIFKGGSGSGTNYSRLRSKNEKLSNGGIASGPVSFMKGYDSFAGIIKSAGAARRAAKLAVLDVNHPDIMEYIESKYVEELKAKALIEAGYSADFSDVNGAYATVAFQNENHSVRVSDKFMRSVKDDNEWELISVVGKNVIKKLRARDIFKRICECAHACGEPGLQFSDTINSYHTTPVSGEIRASNPCIAKGSFVTTDNGDIKIEDLVDKRFNILCGDGRYRTSTVVYTGKKDCIRIKTNFGSDFIVTPDHKIATCYEERSNEGFIFDKAEDLTEVLFSSGAKLRVSMILDAGVRDVYDFIEPVTHTGIVNNVVMHNCGEYLDIDNSACNLGSHNLMRYISRMDNSFFFDVDSFSHAVKLTTLAQEIVIDNSSFPTKEIENNTRRHRQLGIGFANLGALIMYCGYPYDSDNGRVLASAISSLMTSSVYYASTLIAGVKGPFDAFKDNKKYMYSVLMKHDYNTRSMSNNIQEEVKVIKDAALDLWSSVLENYNKYGCRNSKATVIAPTGTIGFMMDCDTTGAEPEMSIIKNKKMVGGGYIKIVNKTVGDALKNLGYNESDITRIIEYIHNNEEIEKCSILRKEHLPVFDCSMNMSKSGRHIKPEGHIKMLAAIQPYISGGISKTVNMPENSTIDDVYNTFMLAYDMGVKDVTIYRNGSKSSQPISFKDKEKPIKVTKRVLPDERESITHKFNIGSEHKGYVVVGFYPDRKPGELFIEIAKAGSTMNGLLDCFATAVSIGLQYGVPLEKFINKFAYVSFEPQGFSKNPNIGYARSVIDYIFRYLEKYVGKDGDKYVPTYATVHENDEIKPNNAFKNDAPMCAKCGHIMERNGRCYRCTCCGESSGCG